MAFLDMFDKVDDIIYKPIETICDWTKEPLNRWKHKRDMQEQQQNIAAAEREKAAERAHEQALAKQETEKELQNIAAAEREKAAERAHEQALAKQETEKELALAKQAAENEEAQKRLEQELTEQERASQTADYEARAKIDADVRRWNAEIDQFILEQEDARRDRLVECVKRYQIDLANAAKDIVESIGLMSLELRNRANEMVLEKTKEYRALQDESKKQSMQELKEVKEMFFDDDPDTYKIMVSNIMNERSSAVELAGRFIVELSEDMKRLNQNTDELMRMGMENTNKFIQPMSSGLGVSIGTTVDDVKRIEG